MTSYDKQESAGNIIVLILYYYIVVFPLSVHSFVYLLVRGDDVSRRAIITSLRNVPKIEEGRWLLLVSLLLV